MLVMIMTGQTDSISVPGVERGGDVMVVLVQRGCLWVMHIDDDVSYVMYLHICSHPHKLNEEMFAWSIVIDFSEFCMLEHCLLTHYVNLN